MGDIVNLNKYRKQRQRTEHAKQAAENRVRFGRSKSDRARTRSEQDRSSQDLEGKRRDDGSGRQEMEAVRFSHNGHVLKRRAQSLKQSVVVKPTLRFL
jgi:hypothetical protein